MEAKRLEVGVLDLKNNQICRYIISQQEYEALYKKLTEDNDSEPEESELVEYFIEYEKKHYGSDYHYMYAGSLKLHLEMAKGWTQS